MLYQLTKQYYAVIKNFPKEYKYTLGNETISLLWDCLDLAVEVNAAANNKKAEKIFQLSCIYEKLKLRIRMSQEIKLISARQFAHIEENYMLEIGRMIGGWLKWALNCRGGGQLKAFFVKFMNTIFTYQKLYKAYLDCRKNKRKTVNALKFEMNLEKNLESLLAELKSKNYYPGRSICFVVTKPVPREIFAADFRDRIVHHLLVNEIIDYGQKRFIFDSYACLKSKGTHKAVSRLRKFIRRVLENKADIAYYAQLDIKGFFMAINHDILYGLAEKLILKQNRPRQWREDMLWLAKLIIFHKPSENYIVKGNPDLFNLIPAHKSLRRQPRGNGLPIGNYTSQFFANLYLNELDQFVKRNLKCRHYIRYVDDFILISKDKLKLLEWRDRISDFLKADLKLELNLNKTRIQILDKGIDFLGYFIKPDYILVRQKVVRRLKDKLHYWRGIYDKSGKCENLLAVLNSYCGHFAFARSYNLKQNIYLKDLGLWKSKFEFSENGLFFKVIKK